MDRKCQNPKRPFNQYLHLFLERARIFISKSYFYRVSGTGLNKYPVYQNKVVKLAAAAAAQPNAASAPTRQPQHQHCPHPVIKFDHAFACVNDSAKWHQHRVKFEPCYCLGKLWCFVGVEFVQQDLRFAKQPPS